MRKIVDSYETKEAALVVGRKLKEKGYVTRYNVYYTKKFGWRLSVEWVKDCSSVTVPD